MAFLLLKFLKLLIIRVCFIHYVLPCISHYNTLTAATPTSPSFLFLLVNQEGSEVFYKLFYVKLFFQSFLKTIL